MITHEQSFVLRKIREGVVQETVLVERLMKDCNLARWEAWRVIHWLRKSGYVEESYAERKDRRGRTVKVMMFELSKKGKNLF